jgi:hypothetical protein
MSVPEPFETSSKGVMRLLGLVEHALTCTNPADFAAIILPELAAIGGAKAAFLLSGDTRLSAPCFHFHGLEADLIPLVKKHCTEQIKLVSGGQDKGGKPVSVPVVDADKTLAHLNLYGLGSDGVIGLAWLEAPPTKKHALPVQLQTLLQKTFEQLLERIKMEQQLAHLNTYQTVSSILAQPLGLNEIMETILYSCMEVVSAEAASILLLDDDKKNFFFYQVEGPTKPLLLQMKMPADQGVAGAVLQSQQPEIINDAQHDPRLYKTFDTQSLFITRNMMVIPLAAGGENEGVLEILNKSDGGDFDQEELFLLMLIAEEIAFAIRNAKIFEYVVNSYCKQRQGLATCKGCERPLGAWTPCVKYRETGTWAVTPPS